MFRFIFKKDDVLRGALYILNSYFCDVCERVDLQPYKFPEPTRSSPWMYWSVGISSRGGQLMKCFSDKTDSVLNYFIFRIETKFFNNTNKRKREEE